eukprot:gene23694-29940_t
MSPGCKRASGGSGGRGGNVYLIADPEINSLKFQTFHYNANDGKHGGSAGLTGRNGRDTYIRVPVGTTVSEKVSDDFYEVLEEEGYEQIELPVHRLDAPKATIQVAEGGKPGTGNSVLAKSKRQKSLPATKLPGEPGQSKVLHLELKIIADVGLVGFPNAGKSSLVRALSNATPKVDSYPFTTLHPSIGVVEYSDMERITVADIPGLIEGAHENRGLGHEFLKHIERTKVLLFVLDMAGVDDRRPYEDLSALLHELKMYDETLLERPAMIFANKYDLKIGKVNQRKMEALAAEHGLKIISGSAQQGEGLAEIAKELRLVVTDLRRKEKEALRVERLEIQRVLEEEKLRAQERAAEEGVELEPEHEKRNVGRH